jgi:DNA-binding transcriptional regulator LsrR (DeoR family)
MARSDELRLLAQVARMYFLDGMKQAEIAGRLLISQASISRLLARAREEGVVRISVAAPRGTFPALEAQLRQRYGLSEAVVADCAEDREEQILARIGEAAAHYLETTLQPGEVIGISSWSESLLRMVDAIHAPKRLAAESVVQILGGMGNPAVQAHATALTSRLAQLTSARALLLTTQGVAGSEAASCALRADPFVQATLGHFPNLTMALVGVGAVEPSKLLADSGNIFTPEELAELAQRGAVGDICLRFFDRCGRTVDSSFDARVIGITVEALRKVPRVVAVAGGARKVAALRGVLRAGVVDVMITDRFTAAALAESDMAEEAAHAS